MTGMAQTFHTDRLVLVEHELRVPLDHATPAGPQLSVFAREVADPDGRDRPYLVFLQGGPGNEAPRPTRDPSNPPWLDRALRDFRVLMVDQRGTGRSTPVAARPDLSAAEQAEHLALFRADSIVADLELLREALGVTSWSVLGQSFGGFCALHYLCVAPQSLTRVLFTGGLPPVGRHIDEVYAATYATMLERNARYYERYPTDRTRVEALHRRLRDEDIVLPHGAPLTTGQLRSVGSGLGMSDGAERLHYLLERDPGSAGFAHDVSAAMPFGGRDPLYAVLQEACYADGFATRWAARRTRPEAFAEDPTLFYGEHVFPETFADHPALSPFAAAVDLLAEREWSPLYDAGVLGACEVPCAAAIYAHDAYVDRALSEETAALLPRMRPWVTDELEHNGLRVDGERVLDRLLALTALG